MFFPGRLIRTVQLPNDVRTELYEEMRRELLSEMWERREFCLEPDSYRSPGRSGMWGVYDPEGTADKPTTGIAVEPEGGSILVCQQAVCGCFWVFVTCTLI